MTSINPLFDAIRKVAENNPELKAKLDKMIELARTKGDQAHASRVRFKQLVDQLTIEKFDGIDITFGLVTNLALVTYVAAYGNRAKARDVVAAALDAAFDGIDERARKNGLYDTLREAEKAIDSGDLAAHNRVIDKANSSRWGI